MSELTERMGNNYKTAGLFLIISGLLYLPMFLMGGLTQKTIQMFVVGLIWVALGVGLRRKVRFLPCLVYVLMLAGMVAALTGLNAGPVPNWWWWLIFLADLIAAFFLFRIIWLKP